MPSLENALGLHEMALRLRSRRTEVLASNIANADTPYFKARDFDFHAVLSDYRADPGADAPVMTNGRHIGQAVAGDFSPLLQYRNPYHSSVDGNTVDGQVEKTKFMENSLHYQSTVAFIDGKIKGLRKAIKGE